MATRFRDLTSLEDCQRVVALEKEVWGSTEDVVPVPILIVTVKRGGILIGAFRDAAGGEDEMVGFVYSLSGLKAGKPMQWSHMLGVAEPYRRLGLGFDLKLAQRDRALAMGLDVIEWTFDPLQGANAHLNLHKLGAIVEEYEENIYGESSSPLHRGTPTDRFVAHWRLSDPEVVRRLGPGGGGMNVRSDNPEAPALVTRLAPDGPWLSCVEFDLHSRAPRVAAEIPLGFTELQQQAPALARAWRAATRNIFTAYLARGYRVVDFQIDRDAGRGRYVLEK